MIEGVLLFGDDIGIPQLLRHLPQNLVCGIVVAGIRPHQHSTLRGLAQKLSLPFIIQPKISSIGYADFLKQVQELEPNLILVNSYSMLLQPEVLAIPQYGAVNIHGALLPEYRGANPTQWALLSDEAETGVTIHYMDNDFDSGDIIAQQRIPIYFEDTWRDIYSRIGTEIEKMLAEELPKLLSGTNTRQPQDKSHARHWRRRHPEDGLIDWQQSPHQIYNLIRALVKPLPGAFYVDASGNRIVLDEYMAIEEVVALKASIKRQVPTAKYVSPARKVVAIHQPNFFPWLGYFNKLARADIFILMDNVQFPKKGGGWGNRVQLIINGQPAWVTMPIVRAYHGTRLVRDMQINNSTPWREQLLKTAQINYARTPFFNQIFPLFENLINNPTDNLVNYNETAIRAIAKAIGLDMSRLVIGSTLDVVGEGTDLLISMTCAVGGTAYLCGGGADNYQENDKFAQAGIELIYQRFQHPVYPQINTSSFAMGLSIVDALMHCGIEGTRLLIQQSRSKKDAL